MAGDASSSGGGSLRKRVVSQFKRVLNIARLRPRGQPSTSAAVHTPVAATPIGSVTPPPPPPPTIPEPAPVPVLEPESEPEPERLPPRQPAAAMPVYRPAGMLTALERANALFMKHGMEINTANWPLSKAPPGKRVEKEIRMRVHRTCHKCAASFGAEKICPGCNHKRCKKCPKYPVKKSGDKGKGKEGVVEKIVRRGRLHYNPILTIPSRTGGQDRVRKTTRQRVHRFCHRCRVDFAGERLCRNCGHTRCRSCPHDPYKRNKPPGYYERLDPEDSEPEVPATVPRRRTFKKHRRRVHWVCTKCNTTFVERAKKCEECGSHRDDTGLRDPPRRQPYRPTEEDLQRLNDRLRQTSLSAT